jgi:hypothetical protein
MNGDIISGKFLITVQLALATSGAVGSPGCNAETAAEKFKALIYFLNG